jgi:hypothetical protein
MSELTSTESDASTTGEYQRVVQRHDGTTHSSSAESGEVSYWIHLKPTSPYTLSGAFRVASYRAHIIREKIGRLLRQQ